MVAGIDFCNHLGSENEKRKAGEDDSDILRFGEQVFGDINWGQNEGEGGDLRAKCSVYFWKY